MSPDPSIERTRLPGHVTLPILDLGTFRLRRFRQGDAEAWSSYLSDPRVTRHTSWGPTDPDTIKALVDRLISENSYRWAIARTDDDLLVGVCGFSIWSAVHRTSELVYDLSPDYWRKGVATRAVQTVLSWGFTHAGLNRVQAVVLLTNEPSIALLRRCGFQREGILRHYRLVRGEPQDFLLFSRLRTDPPCRPHDI